MLSARDIVAQKEAVLRPVHSSAVSLGSGPWHSRRGGGVHHARLWRPKAEFNSFHSSTLVFGRMKLEEPYTVSACK
jgi:hypothetical protein